MLKVFDSPDQLQKELPQAMESVQQHPLRGLRTVYYLVSAPELNSMVTQQHITALLPSFQTLLADHSARHSLTGLPYTSAELLPSDSDATTNLESAYKLRHRALFRECFIYIVGPWSYPQDKQSPDEPLFRLADATYEWKESLESAAEKFTQRTREMNLRSRLQA